MEAQKADIDYTKSVWTSESWSISWAYADTVHIEGPHGQSARLYGSDFEFALQAICAAFETGQRDYGQ